MLRLLCLFAGALLWSSGGFAAQPPLGSGAPSGEVVRAAFTSAVVEREPLDSILALGASESHIYCFTELRGFAGQRVTHRWELDGQVMAEVGFEVGGWRWRVWSRKELLPHWRGQWRVSVVDQDGRVVWQRLLGYQAARAD